MKPHLTTELPSLTYKQAVQKAYSQILKEAKTLLATIEEEPLRYMLTREDKKPIATGTIIHELVSPLLYLRLECYANDEIGIHYGWELSPTFGEYYAVTSAFVRLVYKLTMLQEGQTNIESAIRTDWVINNCSEMYEYLEERGCKHHRFELIKHKPKQAKRKLRKVA